MKLYLSSIRVPTPKEFAELFDKPLKEVKMALITNAKDYYAGLAWEYKVSKCADFFKDMGISITLLDLREFEMEDVGTLKNILAGQDIVWAMGGNTFILRYEMQRSGFDTIISELLDNGLIYGGDSAGALVAGTTIAGIGVELVDHPEFTEKVIPEGLSLVPYVVMPHVDNPEFAEVMDTARTATDPATFIELKDSQAAIFIDGDYRIVEGSVVGVD